MRKSVLGKIFIVSLFLLAFFLFYAWPALAGDPSSGGLVPCGGPGGPPCTLCHFVIGFHKLVQYAMYVVAALALVALVLTGITFVISAGSESLRTQAKGFLKSTLIGFAAVVGGYLIVAAILLILSARGDLGVGHTGGWFTFTCKVTSSALNPPPAANNNNNTNPQGQTTAAPGTLGGACGNNNYGKCEAALTGANFNNNPCLQPGKQWLWSGGTACGTGLWCCADLVQQGQPCVGMGRTGTCETLYGTGGLGTTSADQIVCPNRSWRLQQATNAEPNCAQGLGCCDMSPANADTAPGIINSPCGPIGSDATCSPGTILDSCPSGKTRLGITGRACGSGLICCGSPSSVPTNFDWSYVIP
jgi:hypothetical protein